MPETAKLKYNKEFWGKLFDRYYHDEIIDLATVFTENGTLKIEFSDMKRVWGHIGETSTSGIEFFVNNPNQALLDANDTLQNFSLPVDPPGGWSKKAHVEISGVEPVMAIRDIRHEHLEKFVAIKGTILRKTDVKFNITTAAFKCQRCDHVTHVYQPTDGIYTEPFECDNEVCGRKGSFKLVPEESILEEGCRDPLVVWGNTLVDGHHRYEICTKHNIPFNTVQREFASRSDVKIWIAKNQFAKRNLSNWDRCMLALSLEDAFREKARDNIKYGSRKPLSGQFNV